MKVENNKAEADALDGVGNPAMEGDAGAGMTDSRRNTVASDYKTRILECAKTNNYLRHVLKAFTAHDGAVDWEKAFPAVAVTMAEDSHALREMIGEIEKNENAVFKQVKKLFKSKSAVEAILVIDKSGDRKDVTVAVSELIRQNSALADGVANLAKANPDIARIVETHTAGGRVDYAAALLEVVRTLELTRMVDDPAGLKRGGA